MVDRLVVADGSELATFGFEDLIRYHGRASIGGLAIGYKALERGLPLLESGRPPPRRLIGIDVAFDGPGSRDAFEMVTRAVTEDRYSVVDGLGPEAPEAPQGRFAFRLTGPYESVVLVLCPGIVGDDFVDLVRRTDRSEAEEALLVDMKEELAARIMAKPPDQVFSATLES